ncbi:MAG: methyltransferase domain-containing protein [Pseudonocardiaceae bacterium]
MPQRVQTLHHEAFQQRSLGDPLGSCLSFQPSELCTSSASKPDLVLSMLGALDLHDGHTVLEIGTGTGYNAALLAARLGASNVTTVEIDPALADAARAALDASRFPVTVVTGDGAQGHPDRAPYDRVIATPMRTDFGGSVPLTRFTVDKHGTATGSPVGRVGFMADCPQVFLRHTAPIGPFSDQDHLHQILAKHPPGRARRGG